MADPITEAVTLTDRVLAFFGLASTEVKIAIARKQLVAMDPVYAEMLKDRAARDAIRGGR